MQCYACSECCAWLCLHCTHHIFSNLMSSGPVAYSSPATHSFPRSYISTVNQDIGVAYGYLFPIYIPIFPYQWFSLCRLTTTFTTMSLSMAVNNKYCHIFIDLPYAMEEIGASEIYVVLIGLNQVLNRWQVGNKIVSHHKERVDQHQWSVRMMHDTNTKKSWKLNVQLIFLLTYQN